MNFEIQAGAFRDKAGNVNTTFTKADTKIGITSVTPTIVAVNAETNDGVYSTGDKIKIKVRFSETVDVDEKTPLTNPLRLELNDCNWWCETICDLQIMMVQTN